MNCGKKWDPGISSPWLTRAEAADYLRWSVRTVDRYVIEMGPDQVPGHIRFTVQFVGTTKKIRLLAKDVYAISPLPQGDRPAPEPIKLVV